MSTLFPDRAELQKPGEGASPLLASFKAGVLQHKPVGDGSYQVTADPRRGRCTIVRRDDGTRAFQWAPRDTSDTAGKIDFLLAQGEQVFKRVSTGVDADRVYLLQSTVVDSRRFFFWLQEVDASKDHEIVNTVNGLFGADVAPQVDGNALNELDSVLRGLGFEPSDFAATEGAPAPAADTQERAHPVLVPFTAMLNNERVRALVERPDVQAELLPLLPEGRQTAAELRETLNSPQFQVALRRLSGACMSGQYNDLMSNFLLNPADGAEQLMQGNGIAAVVAALVARAQREGRGSGTTAVGSGSGGGDGAATGEGAQEGGAAE